jgi:heme/copper-type cytochrome/quinol oxidase subunit 1
MQFHGDLAVFQYLFWLYSHPAVCIMLLSLILTGGGLWFWKRTRLSLN